MMFFAEAAQVTSTNDAIVASIGEICAAAIVIVLFIMMFKD